MMELIDLALIFLLNLFTAGFLGVLGYYYYKNYYLAKIEQVEPEFAEGLAELFNNVSKDISESISKVKVDFDIKTIADTLTEQFFGTFLAILGVSEEYTEDWSFKNYIRQIIDSSVEKIVPDTIEHFEKLLPEFADSFIEGIQKALAGAVEGMPEGTPAGAVAAQGGGAMPDMDIGKMIQMFLLQYMMKQMGGTGGLSGLLGGLGGSGGGGTPPSGNF